MQQESPKSRAPFGRSVPRRRSGEVHSWTGPRRSAFRRSRSPCIAGYRSCHLPGGSRMATPWCRWAGVIPMGLAVRPVCRLIPPCSPASKGPPASTIQARRGPGAVSVSATCGATTSLGPTSVPALDIRPEPETDATLRQMDDRLWKVAVPTPVGGNAGCLREPQDLGHLRSADEVFGIHLRRHAPRIRTGGDRDRPTRYSHDYTTISGPGGASTPRGPAET